MNKIIQDYKTLVVFTFVIASLFLASRIPTHAQVACTSAPQAYVSSAYLMANPGETVNNQLMIRNTNPVECGNIDYVISRSYPSGWTLNITNTTNVAPQTTTAVPFSITTAASGVGGSYPYQFWIARLVGDSTPVTTALGLIQIIPPTPTATNTPTPTATYTPTPTNTPTATYTPSPTPTFTLTPTPTPDITAPVVNITSPTHMSTVPRNSSVTITATATDNVAVTQVKFYVDNALKCTDTTAPYTCVFSTATKKNVTHMLKAQAEDAALNISSHTIQVITK